MGRPALNLIKQRFGRLIVLERVIKQNNNKNSFWRCLCDCGNETVVTGTSLKSGRTLSCGCLNDEKRRGKYKDLTGKRFGKLTVLEKTSRRAKNRDIIWRCRCDCGNICEVAGGNLGKGTISCGCIKAEMLMEDCVEDTRLRNLTMKRQNRQYKKDSGCKGVTWREDKKRWRAAITIQKKRIFLGYFKEDELDKAIEARKKAEEIYFSPILEKHKEKDK